MSRESEAEIDAYVRRLLWALQALPQEDRLNIASEIHGHLNDCASRGPAELERALRRLGTADRLARAYVEEYELAGAVNRASPVTLLLSVLNRATRSLLACGGGLAALVLYFFAIAFALTAVAKLIVPGDVGAWVIGGRMLSIGLMDTPPPGAKDLLGYWIVPIAVLCGAVCFVGAGKLLRLIGVRLLARSRSALPA
jgi:uncharacterized membrane protein